MVVPPNGWSMEKIPWKCWTGSIRSANELHVEGYACRTILHEQLYKLLRFGGWQQDKRSHLTPSRSQTVVSQVHAFDITTLAGPDMLELLEHGCVLSTVSPIFFGQSDALCLELFSILR